MKKHLYIIVLLIIGCACHRVDDFVVAEVYNQKLYHSEIQNLIPLGLTPSDSTQAVEKIVEEWLKQQILLHEADRILKAKEKNFDKELTQYRNNLLIQSYMKKITSDSARFSVTDKEVEQYMTRFGLGGTEEQYIVKLNYIKISSRSKIKQEVRELLFDKSNRIENRQKLKELCADSLEYFLDLNTWVPLNDIQYSLPVDVKSETFSPNNPKNIEKCDDNFCYLIVLLDYRKQTMPVATPEDRETIKAMLIQEKKNSFLDSHIEELYQKTIKDEMLVR